MDLKPNKILAFPSKPVRIVDKTQEEIIAERRATRQAKIDKLLYQYNTANKNNDN